MKKEFQPKPVRKINCPKCGELMVKIFPYSSLDVVGPNGQLPTFAPCRLCQSKIKNGK